MKKKILAVFVYMLLFSPIINYVSANEVPDFTKDDCKCPELGMEMISSHAQWNEMFKAKFEKNSSFHHNTFISHETWRYLTIDYLDSKFQLEVVYLQDHMESIKGKSNFDDDYEVCEEIITDEMASFIYGYHSSTDVDFNQASRFIGYKHFKYLDTFLISMGSDYFESKSDILESFSILEECIKSVLDSKIGVAPAKKILKGVITGIGKPIIMSDLLKLSENDKEKIIERGLTASDPIPMKHMKLKFINGKDIIETTTDSNGNFEIEIDSLEFGKEYELDIWFTYKENNTEYFLIHLSKDNPIFYPYKFKIDSDDDLTQYIKLEDFLKPEDGTIAFVYLYNHFSEALEFYKNYLNENLDFQLPVEIYSFYEGINSPFNEYYKWENGKSYIYLDVDASSHRSVNKPYDFYHEFSHFAHHAICKKMPEGRNIPKDIQMINHDGFINPSTADSYSEAFAIFMSMIIAQYYSKSPVAYDCTLYNVENDFTVWQFQGKAEEFALAGVLWDLYDGPEEHEFKRSFELEYELERFKTDPSPGETREEIIQYNKERVYDDDNVDLSFQEIWKIISIYHPDFKSVYDSFINNYSSIKDEINQIFIKHGVFADTDEGNHTYDREEPKRDNYFIDYAMEKLYNQYIIDIDWNENETIGQATNYERPWRTNTAPLPGNFIKVENLIPYYWVNYQFGNEPYFNHTIRTKKFNDNYVYVRIPPKGYNVTIIVQAETEETLNPLSFNTDEFYKNYDTILKNGYFKEYDFEISGDVYSGPVAPNFSWSSSTESKVNNGSPGFEIMFLLAAIIISIFFVKMRKFENNK